MKIELVSTIQMLFILMLIVGVVTCAITSIKNSIKKLNYDYVKKIFTRILDYSRFMVVKNYFSYEKYDIWRYCVHF